MQITASSAFAISDYGRKCDDNLDCLKCRDEDVKCSICMNKCWDQYGPPDTEESKSSHDKNELCRIRIAKWCNAQCWDPDDKAAPNYVSSKPVCSSTPFPSTPIFKK